MINLDKLHYDAKGLIPVITQDAFSGEVLMFAYANKEALEQTLKTKEAHYYSRSRQELWHKGATSGHIQSVLEMRFDCDKDAILYRVKPLGPACHTGERSCFYRPIGDTSARSIGDIMALLERIIDERFEELPKGSYVTSLHKKGLGYMAQKVVEEAGESIVAALQKKDGELLDESADLLFHLVVLLKARGLSLRQVSQVLEARHKDNEDS